MCVVRRLLLKTALFKRLLARLAVVKLLPSVKTAGRGQTLRTRGPLTDYSRCLSTNERFVFENNNRLTMQSGAKRERTVQFGAATGQINSGN